MISVSKRFFQTGRMSRSKIARRIEPVLSAIRASLNQRLPTAPKFWEMARVRFARCFACAGERPSDTSFLAARHRSRASDSETPSAPYLPSSMSRAGH